MKELKLKSGSALVIVAHPDDETIWMGGTILAHPQVRWTILSLCRAFDPDRAPKFRKVCRYYGAKSIIADLEDEGIMNVDESVPKIKRIIKSKIGRKHFDYLFTHRYNGEYGHPRHIGINRAVKNLILDKKLSAKRFFTFGYFVPFTRKLPLPNKHAKFSITLSQKIFSKKGNIIEKIYGFSRNSFEYKSASILETFYAL